MSSTDIRKQKHHERETEAYKNFLVIAKRIKAIEYDKKWELLPDPSDPLRKYIFQRDTPWFKLRVVLRYKEYHHRWGGSMSYEQRYDYKFYIGFQGFFADKAGPITLTSTLLVRPRVTKKLIEVMNNNLLPNIYAEIMRHEEKYNKSHNQKKYFENQLQKLGIKTTDSPVDLNKFLSIPFTATASTNKDKIELGGEVTFDQFARICKTMGWIK